MDKNTIIGFLLILGIIVGFGWLNQPSKEVAEARRRYNDSIAAIAQAQQAAIITADTQKQENDTTTNAVADISKFGYFESVAKGTDERIVIENELIKLTFATKGGGIYSAELKNYYTHDSLPLILFEGAENSLNYTVATSDNRVINTSDLYFSPIVRETPNGTGLTLRLDIAEGAYIDFDYYVPNNSFLIDYTVASQNAAPFLSNTMNLWSMEWKTKIRQQEKGRKFENRYATLNFKYAGDDMESLSESSDAKEEATGKVQWIAYKDQFFSTVLLAKTPFNSPVFTSRMESDKSAYLKSYSTNTMMPFDLTGKEATEMQFYFGPNHYSIVKSYNDKIKSEYETNLEEIVPLGWSLFRYVNKWLIIPIFDFFSRFTSNYGLIILLLTIVIKLITAPFTYKSYISSAKMRVLKPQIDAINEKIPADKALERQQATMNLYKRAGVSPMSGCIPMLLSMPFLIAMFQFFPTAIELRQQSFLWANDLSSYDAIFSWDTYIPLVSPYFGNHISLFCLLMTITNIFYTKINMASNSSNSAMPGMNMIMYLMPVMFLFIFNDYASGLSYYYFISLLLTIGQTYLMKLFVDDDKLLAQLEANKKKPAKKSGFMSRLEEAQRLQQQKLKQQQKVKQPKR